MSYDKEMAIQFDNTVLIRYIGTKEKPWGLFKKP